MVSAWLNLSRLILVSTVVDFVLSRVDFGLSMVEFVQADFSLKNDFGLNVGGGGEGGGGGYQEKKAFFHDLGLKRAAFGFQQGLI